jgi:Mg2+/Co2+ transporter CorC
VHYTGRAYFISGLLKEFRQGWHHMSVVLSDSQKVIGLVSIEDIVEQIFGKIYDEYDTKLK